MADTSEPEYYTSPNGMVAIKLNMQPGDQALLCAVSGNERPGSKGASIFVYPDRSTTIVGCQDRDETIHILEMAANQLRASKSWAKDIVSSDPQKPS